MESFLRILRNIRPCGVFLFFAIIFWVRILQQIFGMLTDTAKNQQISKVFLVSNLCRLPQR